MQTKRKLGRDGNRDTEIKLARVIAEKESVKVNDVLGTSLFNNKATYPLKKPCIHCKGRQDLV